MPGVELLGNVGLLIHDETGRGRSREEEEEEEAAGHGGQIGLSTHFSLSSLSLSL